MQYWLPFVVQAVLELEVFRLSWSYRPAPSHPASVETFQVQVTLTFGRFISSVGVLEGFVCKVAPHDPSVAKAGVSIDTPQRLVTCLQGGSHCACVHRFQTCFLFHWVELKAVLGDHMRCCSCE